MGSNGMAGHHNKPIVDGPGIVVGRKGSAGSVQWVGDNFWPIDTTYYVKPKQDVDLRYLFYTLSSCELEKLRNGAGVPGLNRDDVYNAVKIPLPPLETQRQIVAEFAEEQPIAEANKTLITLYEQKIKSKLTEVWGE
jgi:restriction endonuclease S subunit